MKTYLLTGLLASLAILGMMPSASASTVSADADISKLTDCVGNVATDCNGGLCVGNALYTCDSGLCLVNAGGNCDATCVANVLTACNEGICVGNVASSCDGPLCVANVLTTCGQNSLIETILALLRSTSDETGSLTAPVDPVHVEL